MDWLTFASSVLEAVAWPLAIFGAVFILRGDIRKLLDSISSLSWRGATAQFARELQAAEVAGEDLPQEPVSGPVTDQFRELAILSPRAAVLEAWRDVEIIIHRYLRSMGMRPSGPQKPGWLEIRKTDVPAAVKATIEDLRHLRNAAAHGDERSLTADEALAYRTLAERVVAALTELIPEDFDG